MGMYVVQWLRSNNNPSPGTRMRIEARSNCNWIRPTTILSLSLTPETIPSHSSLFNYPFAWSAHMYVQHPCHNDNVTGKSCMSKYWALTNARICYRTTTILSPHHSSSFTCVTMPRHGFMNYPLILNTDVYMCMLNKQGECRKNDSSRDRGGVEKLWADADRKSITRQVNNIRVSSSQARKVCVMISAIRSNQGHIMLTMCVSTTQVRSRMCWLTCL